jgi:hypothetical protein
VLGPETALSAPKLRLAPGVQSLPAVATNGKDFFVSWTDERFGDRDIFGTRVDGEGRVLDPGGIAVYPTRYRDQVSDVVWNGSSYIVAFATDDVGIDIADVGANGEVFGTLPLLAPRWVYDVSIAWSGSTYLVAWTEAPSGVHARVYDSDLHPIGQELVLGSGYRTAVASNGSGFLVAWIEAGANTAKLVTVTTSGAAGEPVVFTQSFTTDIAVASNGVDYLVACGGVSGQPGDAVLNVSARGEILHRVEIANARQPALAWDGLQYVAVWNPGSGLYGGTFDAAGTLTREPVRIAAYDISQRDPDIAANANAVLVTWGEHEDIHSARFAPRDFAAPDGLGEGAVVSFGVTNEVPLDAVWSGSTLNVLTREGDLTDETHVVLRGAANVDFGRAENGAIAASGEKVAVAYTSDFIPYVQVIGAAPVKMSGQHASRIGIASDGQQFAAFASATTPQTVIAARFDASGAMTVPAHVVSPPLTPELYAYSAVATRWTGSEYAMLLAGVSPFVVGRFTYSEPHAFLLRLDRDLQPIGAPLPVDVQRFANVTDLATSGQDLLVTSIAMSGSQYELQTSRMTLEGRPIGPRTVLSSGAYLYDVRATWNGRDYVITARDDRAGAISVWQGGERTMFTIGARNAFVVKGALIYSRPVAVVADMPYSFVERTFWRLFAKEKVRAAR